MRENAWLGAIMYPVALMWYGWSAQEGVFWLCPVSNFSLIACTPSLAFHRPQLHSSQYEHKH